MSTFSVDSLIRRQKGFFQVAVSILENMYIFQCISPCRFVENFPKSVLSDSQLEAVEKVVETDYGFPRIHHAFKQYVVHKNEECTNPTHLILFAKQSGIQGVHFAKCNKYFKARKKALGSRPSSPQKRVSTDPPMDEKEGMAQSEESGHSALSDDGAESVVAPGPPTSGPTEEVEQSVAESVTSMTETEAVSASEDEKDEERVYSQQSDDGGIGSVGSANGGGRRASMRKRKRKLLVAAEAVASGRLKKVTDYRRFEVPLYAETLNVAERKKAKDEGQLIREWGLQIGHKVLLKREGLKGTVRFIGCTHFTFGIVIGLEMAGNGHGKHCGDIDKIRYFEVIRGSVTACE